MLRATAPRLAAFSATTTTAATATAATAQLSTRAADMMASFDHPRWAGVRRPYTRLQVEQLAGTKRIKHTLAEEGAVRLWDMLRTEPFIASLGAQSGMAAVQQVKAGIKAIYVSGWQVAADANSAGAMYPDQSLYPCNSVPLLAQRINNSLARADQIQRAAGAEKPIDFYVPLVADAEAGFGGPLNAFEMTKAMIHAGVAAVHFEDQVSSEKKCGHLGGKVLVPTKQFKRTLSAARLAADIEGVPTVLIARTDAESAKFVISDADPADAPFLTGKRTDEGFFQVTPGRGRDFAIARGLAYADHADMLWWETSTPDLNDARVFADAVHAAFPGKPLAYNCSPSFMWQSMGPDAQRDFQAALGRLGYKYQFVTLAGFHSMCHTTYQLSRAYVARGMQAYAALQAEELKAAPLGYTAVRHQQEVGTGYFDSVLTTACGNGASTLSMADSTETSQF